MPPSHASSGYFWILTFLCVLALESLHTFQYFQVSSKVLSKCFAWTNSQHTQLLGPWNFPFLWCSVPLRIACSAGEENNFFLHCFISFLGNDGTYFRKVRFDLSCENWLFLLTPLLPFLLGNEGRWISVVNNSIYQHGVSLFLIPLQQIMP